MTSKEKLDLIYKQACYVLESGHNNNDIRTREQLWELVGFVCGVCSTEEVKSED